MTNENNPGIRLIDANALLRQDDPTYDEEGFRIWYTVDINRVPTIEPENKRAVALIDRLYDGRAINNKDKGILSRAILLNEVTRPSGTWADVGPFTYNGLRLSRFKCSNCGLHHFTNSLYCPACGAYMQGGTLWQEK